MRRLVLIPLLLSNIFLFQSCENVFCCDLPPDCCEIPKEVAISVIDRHGNDLLDQSKVDGFKMDDLRVFHFYNNQNHYVLNSNNPNRLALNPKEKLTTYNVNLSEKIENQKSTTIIKWSSDQLDTIDAFFQSEKILSKLIINAKDTISIDTLKMKYNNLSITLTK